MLRWVLVTLHLCAAATVTAGQRGTATICSNGLCVATVEGTESRMGATVALQGPPEALAPLNHDGGWEVWDCDPDVTHQTISIACYNPTGCNDLYRGGAEGTIVKLDKKCTDSEFGVIVAEEKAEDQSVPHKIANRLVKRGVEAPEVRKVTLKKLSEMDGRHGNVSFFVFGSTWGKNPDPAHSIESRATNSGGKQDYFNEVASGMLEISQHLHHQLMSRMAEDWYSRTPIGGKSPKPGPIVDPWAIDKNGSFPIHSNTSLELFQKNLFCEKHARARIGVTAKALVLGKIDIGVVASGVVFPPLVTDFKVFTDITADVEAHLKLGLSVEGTIASGDITLFEIGIPGFNVPGIINVGPAFKIVANAGATLALDMDVDVSLTYGLSDWTNTYPSHDLHGPDLIPGETGNPLTLAVSEHVEAYGVVEGHVIAKLEISVDAFNGKARAAVYLGLDAYAKAKASVKHNGRVVDDNVSQEGRLEPKSIAGRLSVPEDRQPTSTKEISHPAKGAQSRELFGRDRGANINNSICANLLLGLNAHLGAEGNLFDIITHRSRLILWKREWPLLQKCVEKIPEFIEKPLDLQCDLGDYDPWTGKCQPPRGGGMAWVRREVAQPDRVPAPIKCPAAGPLGNVTQLFRDSFKPLTAAVTPNAAT